MMVIMHYALFISHYAGFGTHSKFSNFWVASDSLWVETLLWSIGQHYNECTTMSSSMFGSSPYTQLGSASNMVQASLCSSHVQICFMFKKRKLT